MQRLPEHILEPGNVHTRYRGNEDRRNPLGQMAFHLFDQVLVEHIAFGDGQQALLVEQFRIILGQFAQQDRVILADVVAVGRNHKEEHRIAFDMAQETGSQSPCLRELLR